MMRFLRLLFILVVAITAIEVTSRAEAGVSVKPDRHIVRLTPGERETVAYQVYNAGEQDIDITIDPKDWSGAGDTEVDTKGRGGIGIDTDAEMLSWLYLDETEFTVRAGESRPFTATVTAPEGFEGEYLVMLFLCYKEDKDSTLNIRNGIPLYLVIKGTERYDAEIEAIRVVYGSSPTKKGRSSLGVMLTVRNTGNIQIMPDLTVSIRDSEEVEIRQLRLKKTKVMLRGKVRTFRLNWPNPILPEGRYHVTAGVSYKDKLKGVTRVAEFEVKDGKLEMLEGEGSR